MVDVIRRQKTCIEAGILNSTRCDMALCHRRKVQKCADVYPHAFENIKKEGNLATGNFAYVNPTVSSYGKDLFF